MQSSAAKGAKGPKADTNYHECTAFSKKGFSTVSQNRSSATRHLPLPDGSLPDYFRNLWPLKRPVSTSAFAACEGKVFNQ
jgi:hypothetical protein